MLKTATVKGAATLDCRVIVWTFTTEREDRSNSGCCSTLCRFTAECSNKSNFTTGTEV